MAGGIGQLTSNGHPNGSPWRQWQCQAVGLFITPDAPDYHHSGRSPLPLSRLSVWGHLTELCAADLRCIPPIEERATYLQRVWTACW